VPANLTAGKIITFERNDELITHRIIGIKNNMYQTQGDANEDPDPQPVSPAMIQGAYLFKIPYLGFINSFVANRKGWFVIIIIPTVLLVLFIVKDILKETFKDSGKAKKQTEGGDAIPGKKQ